MPEGDDLDVLNLQVLFGGVNITKIRTSYSKEQLETVHST